MLSWFVYILKCGDGSLYTGCTNNIERRVATHAAGRGGKYTRAHRPVTLVYSEKLKSKSDALKREAEIKGLRRTEKAQLLRRTS